MKLLKRDKQYSKNKSIVLLSAYGVFFIFVFIILATGKTVEQNKSYERYINKDTKNEEKNNNIVNNYEYEYKITDNTSVSLVTGTKTIDKEIFMIDNITYYKKNNNIYLNDGTNTLVTESIFNTDLYSYKNIEELIKERTAKEKTTYENGNIKEIYSINSKEYFDYMNDDKCSSIDCSNIFIDIIINKNDKEQMEKVNINLTNYYKHNYIVELNYNNINNIKEVSTN